MIDILRKLKPTRRWLQFRLRSLLILTTLVGLGIGGWQIWTWYQERAKYFKMLDVDDPDQRVTAIMKIGNMGPHAKAAVPALIEALQDRESVDWKTVQQAGYGESCFYYDTSYYPELDFSASVASTAKELHEGPFFFQCPIALVAAEALGEIGPAAKPAVPTLIAKLEQSLAAYDNDSTPQDLVHPPGVEKPRAEKKEEGISIEDLCHLSDDHLLVASTTIQALGKIGPRAEEAVPLLVRQLQRKQLAPFSGNALVEIGPSAIGPLAKLFDGKKTRLKFYAANTLVRLGPEGINAVVTATRDEKLSQGAAIGALTLCKQQDIVMLWELAQTEKEPLREVVLKALEGIGNGIHSEFFLIQFPDDWNYTRSPAAVDDERAILVVQILDPAVRAAREDNDLKVRIAAIRYLGKGDSFSKKAVPMLLTFLDDENETIQRDAAIAIDSIGCRGVEGAVDILIRKLSSTDPELREAVAKTLFKMREEVDSTRPALLKALEDDNPTVRYYAALIVVDIPDRYKADLVQCLVDMLVKVKGETLIRTIEVLGNCVTDEKNVINLLAYQLITSHLLFQQPDPELVRSVFSALEEIGSPAIDTLVIIINGGNRWIPQIKLEAMGVLESMGPKAITAAPALIEWYEKNNRPDKYRTTLRATLNSIDPQRLIEWDRAQAQKDKP